MLMKKFLFILVLQNFAAGKINSQSFDVDDLIRLPTLSQKSLDHLMAKNHFLSSGSAMDSASAKTWFEQIKAKSKYINTKRSIDIYSSGESRFFSFHTMSLNNYVDGQHSLIKAGFVYNDKKDATKDSNILYQKKNVRVQAIKELKDSITQYTFLLEEKKIPDGETIKYAEDLLRFTSHEYLVSFFGANNISKDLYFFSEKQLRKCSVLFMGSSMQAMFVWGDEDNLDSLSYVLVSNIIPTIAAKKLSGVTNINQWQFKNGIYPGMSINALLQLNGEDFKIYGNPSDLAFMVKSNSSGKIDFTKTAVMLSCNNCNADRVFAKPVIGAMEIVKRNLPMYVYDIIIYPPHK